MNDKQKPKDWKITKFLKEKAPHILDKVGGVLPDRGALGMVKNLISKDDKISKEDKEIALKLIEYDLENTKDARDLQKVALQQEDLFSKRFIYYLAIFWSVVGAAYIFLATFTSVVNEKMADTVLGFLLGTIVATIINFFFGSSKGSKDKNDIISSIQK